MYFFYFFLILMIFLIFGIGASTFFGKRTLSAGWEKGVVIIKIYYNAFIFFIKIYIASLFMKTEYREAIYIFKQKRQDIYLRCTHVY